MVGVTGCPVIGDIAETRQAIDWRTARDIDADNQRTRPDRISQAFDGVRNEDLRRRFVIDTALLQAPP